MTETNDQLVLIAGRPAMGKSASLRSIRNQERWIYNNTEAGKRLPFANKFINNRISDPYEVYAAIQDAIENAEFVDGIIIDSATFMMDMFESQYIYGAANTQKAWADFAQFWKKLLQEEVVKFAKPTIITAHLLEERDENTGQLVSRIPVKGSLKNNGLESYFSTIVVAKKVSLKELEKYTNGLLEVTPEEEELGYKHVFQTRPTKNTVGEPIRSPMGMFTREQTFIDNDAQKLLDHLNSYYGL